VNVSFYTLDIDHTYSCVCHIFAIVLTWPGSMRKFAQLHVDDICPFILPSCALHIT
jgi:hypothetical protein